MFNIIILHYFKLVFSLLNVLFLSDIDFEYGRSQREIVRGTMQGIWYTFAAWREILVTRKNVIFYYILFLISYISQTNSIFSPSYLHYSLIDWYI